MLMGLLPYRTTGVGVNRGVVIEARVQLLLQDHVGLIYSQHLMSSIHLFPSNL